MGQGDSKHSEKDEIELEDADTEEGLTKLLRVHLSRLIVYAESADCHLQRQVAEKLANEAVKPERQVQIVELGGLKLLLPLTQSTDTDVQRLAAHALANLSVNSDNQMMMAEEGGIEMLVALLSSSNEHVQRQGSKALANLGVNVANKEKIARAGGGPLIELAGSAAAAGVLAVEAVAALANLAVNDNNEVEIAGRRAGAHPGPAPPRSVDLQSRCARALATSASTAGRALANLTTNGK
ncbi:unnamed protein product [Heterosigma akashiwo]